MVSNVFDVFIFSGLAASLALFYLSLISSSPSLTGHLHFGETSLIPPLPSILVNESTQEMIMTHCLSNNVTPGVLDVTCLLVYLWLFYLRAYLHSYCTCFKEYFSTPTTHPTLTLLIPQVCLLHNGCSSSCGHPVYSDHKMAKEQRGQPCRGGFQFKHWPQSLRHSED